jgi:hypothetical protein
MRHFVNYTGGGARKARASAAPAPDVREQTPPGIPVR